MSNLTQSQLRAMREEVNWLIRGWLKDDEVCEDIEDYQDEVSKVYQTIAEMVERWDDFAVQYRDATEEYDDSDHQYELEAGK